MPSSKSSKTRRSPVQTGANGKNGGAQKAPRQPKTPGEKRARRRQEEPSLQEERLHAGRERVLVAQQASHGEMSDAVRRYIVESLACFRSPQQVADEVKARFGVEIKRQSVQFYDPTKNAGRNLSTQWCELFVSTRRDYLRGMSNIGVTHQRYRMESLQKQLEQAQRMQDPRLVMAILKHAALEMGGRFSRMKIDGRNAGAILAAMLGVDEEHLPPPQPPLRR